MSIQDSRFVSGGRAASSTVVLVRRLDLLLKHTFYSKSHFTLPLFLSTQHLTLLHLEVL